MDIIHVLLEMTFLDIKLKVPTASVDRAKWILKEVPAAVANASAIDGVREVS